MMLVFENAVDNILGGGAGFVGRELIELMQDFSIGAHNGDAFMAGPNPDPVFTISVNAADIVAADRCWIIFFTGKRLECPGFLVELVNTTFKGSYPDVVLLIDGKTKHNIGTGGFPTGLFLIKPVRFFIVVVVPAQTE